MPSLRHYRQLVFARKDVFLSSVATGKLVSCPHSCSGFSDCSSWDRGLESKFTVTLGFRGLGGKHGGLWSLSGRGSARAAEISQKELGSERSIHVLLFRDVFLELPSHCPPLPADYVRWMSGEPHVLLQQNPQKNVQVSHISWLSQ